MTEKLVHISEITPQESRSDSIDQRLLENWLAFVNRREILTSVAAHIAVSWQRCSAFLNPYDEFAQPFKVDSGLLLAMQAADFNLISVARPVMEDIYQYIERTNTAIVLANSACYILEILGDASMIDMASQNGFINGAQISEAKVGTNAFALSVSERVPALVTGAEHFLQRYHSITAAASPIFDLSGRPLGTLGLVSSNNQHNPYLLALSAAGAQSIASQMWNDLLLAEQNSQVAQLNTILSTVSEGVLVRNADGTLLHINAAAEKIFNMPAHALVGRDSKNFLSFPLFLEEAIQRQEELSNVRAKVRAFEHTVELILSLKFVKDKNDLKWVILTLRRASDVLELAQRRFGTLALKSLDSLEGHSPPIRRVRQLARVAVSAKACILIRGERGTGKSLLATAIHNESMRRDEPFVIFACSSIPRDLMMTELLGLEKNTSSKEPWGQPGKLELAQGGTIFIQDVDMLSLEAQAALLNVLELGIAQRIGTSKPFSVDVRVIAATMVDLDDLIARGLFRSDLYYRLSSFEISMPPLRDRMEDLPVLAETVLKHLSEQFGRPIVIAPEALALMQNYPWPGNLQELEAVLGRAVSQMSGDEAISADYLPDFIHHPFSLKIDSSQFISIRSLGDMERETFLQSARACNGNVNKMVKVLGISRTTLWRKMKQYNIHPKDFHQK
ncbi:MAG: sigma 54-interacting transcriptional regulator [Anaerolineae bacterium]|nr:sigma 54-interacting transcriptional regulator [Anaerolineae bacterium]